MASAGGSEAEVRSGPPRGFFRIGWVRSFPNLNEFFERFQSLNVRSNQELDHLIEQAQKMVQGVTPKDLREDNDLRLRIKLESKEAKDRNMMAGIAHLGIVE